MTRSRLYFAVLLVALLAVTAGCAAAIGDDTDPERIAEQIQQRTDRIDSVQGVRVTIIERDGSANQTVMDYAARPPEQSRTHVLDADGGWQSVGDTIIQNDDRMITYDASNNSYREFETDNGRPDQFISAAAIERTLNRSTVSYDGKDTVAGRDVHVISLERNTAGQESTSTLKVDQEYWYPLAYSTTTRYGDGETTVTMRFRNVTFNEPLSDKTFNFDPPAGATLEDRTRFESTEYDSVDEANAATPFELTEPTLPDSYTLDSAKVVSTNGAKTGALTYLSGETRVVLTARSTTDTATDLDGESISLGETNATVRTFGDSTNLVWYCDDTRYSLSGQVDRSVLEDAARSLGC